ncbi:membrane-bound PQQ-dependent dehydrogenase, glucose/quinate/shikimate family [Aquibium microcysteis]|uniref:membrane-bound PQQ-dependent dehydrogenase, glucose/quinate/shikimate family n=1 Tax=Aquibium microcysteis TaxID=675281 RepID=UPI00165CF511|nr:membrane-bound PQQ-dependent dehydrogenase, glucose/quinate/shikimate family [Aquibium microcysteis]
MARHETSSGRGFGYWYTVVLGVVLALLGLVLAAGGTWLATLGGSWYYLFAGIGLIVSGLLLARQSLAGVSAYLVTWVATLIWAFWEVGVDWWAQVPRIVAPTVLLILVLLCLPVLFKRDRRLHRHHAGVRGAAAAMLVGLAAAAAWPLSGPAPAAAQDDTGPLPPPDQAQEGTPSPIAPADPQEQAPITSGTLPAVPAAPATNETEGQAGPAPGDTAGPTDAVEGEAEDSVGGAGEGEATAAARDPMTMLETGENWPAYGGTHEAQRYSPLDQITKENVSQLEQVWEYHTGALPREGDGSEGAYAAETTPLVIDGTMYLCSAMNDLIALDADTGREIWRFDAGVSTDAIPYSASCRGVAYYAIPGERPEQACATRVIEGTLDARLVAVDAQTGLPCQDFGEQGQVNLLEGIGDSVPGFFSVTSPPTIVRGVVVIGHQVLDNQHRDAPSGVVRGYDAVTGELRWAWDLANPNLDGLPPEGETYTRGTPNMWTIASGDDELGLVYLPLGNSAVDYYGADRRDLSNEYATSLVALDVTTGKPAWHFQTVRYDVWDYDLGSQGTLVDLPAGDRTVPAIVLPSKQGDMYVLNRETGETLFPVEERPVPAGGVEPENLSPTQPFSAYHTLAKRDLTERDMWGMSPLDQLWCRIQFRRANYDGIYTPPSVDRPWIQYPGYNGGSDWGGIAVDPVRGMIIANYNDMPNYNQLVPRERIEELGVRPISAAEETDPDAPDSLSPQGGVPYGIDVNAGWRVPFTGMMCKQPPYGGIRAIDLATGETIWDRPFGTARSNGPFGIPSRLPFVIGTPNNAGGVITAGGLMFIAATTDNLFKAIDVETGETLWDTVLPAGGQATPITYAVDGVQYVAIMAGGHHFMETPIGDSVMAWSLPAGNRQP